MSSQSARVLCETIAGWLEENRPEVTVGTIRAMGDTETRERPEVVVLCEEGESPHPKLRRYEVTLRGEWRPKDDRGDDFTAGFLALAGVLLEPGNFQDLRVSLAAEGLLLRKLRGGVDSEAQEDETARRITLPVSAWVQTDV